MSVLTLSATSLLVILAILLTWSNQAVVNGRRTPREHARRTSSLQGSRWSRWHTAMVPKAPKYSRNYKPRGQGHYGFINNKIKMQFSGKRFDNGIYEIGVSKGKRNQAVYIGSAYRKGPGSIQARIMEYVRDGSHKDALINKALKDGYKISVRAQNIDGSRKRVREGENKYLAKYNFAWNQRNNGRIRGNVP